MYVDIDKLNAIIDKLNAHYSKLRINFASQSDNYRLLKDDNVWHGNAKNNEVLKYEEIVNAYATALNNMYKEITLLKSIKENYEAEEKNLLNKTNEL